MTDDYRHVIGNIKSLDKFNHLFDSRIFRFPAYSLMCMISRGNWGKE